MQLRGLPKEWNVFFEKIHETLKKMGAQGLTPEEAKMLLTGIDPNFNQNKAAIKMSLMPLPTALSVGPQKGMNESEIQASDEVKAYKAQIIRQHKKFSKIASSPQLRKYYLQEETAA